MTIYWDSFCDKSAIWFGSIRKEINIIAKKKKNEYEVLLNAKVIKGTDNYEIHFDNGYILSYHPYETYLEKS